MLAASSARADVREILSHVVATLRGHELLDETITEPVLDRFGRATTKISEMSDRYDEPFRLAIVGDFKAGKSAMVNALTGIPDLVQEGVVPVTGQLTELWYAEEEVGTVLDGNGKTVFQGSVADASRYADQRTPEGKSMLGKGGRVVLKLPLDMLENVVIIDTPGLGANRLDDRVTLGALPTADAAVLVLSARRPGGDRAVDLAERLRSTRKRMLAVVTRTDLVDQESLGAALGFAKEVFGDVIDGDPIPFSSKMVQQAHQVFQQARIVNDEAGMSQAQEELGRWGHVALLQALQEGYFSGDSEASSARLTTTLAETQKLIQGLEHVANLERGHAAKASEQLIAELSETDRIVTEVLEPKLPYLESKIEEIVDKHIGEFTSKLLDALKVFLQRIMDGSILDGLQGILSKVSKGYRKKMEKRLLDEFEDLFPRSNAEIVQRQTSRAVRRLLMLEWSHVASDINQRSGESTLDPTSMAKQLQEHLAQLAATQLMQLTGMILLIFVPGGVVADVVFILLSFLSAKSIKKKESARLARAMREARVRVQNVRYKVVDKLSQEYYDLNERTAKEVIERVRGGSAEKESQYADLRDLMERWRRAHRDLKSLQAQIEAFEFGEAA